MKFMEDVEKDIEHLIWCCNAILGKDNNVSKCLHEAIEELEKWRQDDTIPPPVLRKSKK